MAEGEYEEEAYLPPDEGEVISCLVEKILLAPRVPQQSQRHALFKTRCMIQKNVCEVIIDSESTKNIVSRALVKALALPIDKHPHLYKMGWIKKN